MNKRSKRTSVIENVNVNGTDECDLLLNNFDTFQIKRPTRFYTVVDRDLRRPDVLSITLYGTADYWWIVGKVNNIDDWWNDLKVGDILQVPHVSDIEDWLFITRRS